MKSPIHPARLIFLITTILLGTSAYPQAVDRSTVSSCKWEAGMELHRGFIIAHRPSMEYLQRDHASMVAVSWMKQAEGNKDWQAHYRYPLWGFGYRFFDFGNTAEIGYGHAFTFQLSLPLLINTNYGLSVRSGVGVGYIEKPFDAGDNYKNLAIGSHMNGTITTGIEGRLRLSKKLLVHSGIDFFHFSNGAARMPNLGINIPSLYAGLRYSLIERSSDVISTENRITTNNRKKYSVQLATGLKEKYPPGGPNYIIGSLQVQYNHTRGQKGLFVAGFESILDRSLPAKLEEDNLKGKIMDGQLRIGFYAGAGLRLGRWDMSLQPGIYLLNEVKEDGDVYNRLQLKYHIPSGWSFSWGLKSHFARADYFEWGVGYGF